MRPEEYIEFSIRKMCSEYIVQRWLALALFMSFLFYLVYMEEIEFGLFGVGIITFVVLLCAICIINLWDLYRMQRQLKGKAFPLLKAIYRKKSDAVVWMYQLNTSYTKKLYGLSVHTHVRTKKYLVVVQSDGKRIHIKARSEEQVAELMGFLSEIFPHAVLGYGPYQEADAKARIGRRIRNYLWFEY